MEISVPTTEPCQLNPWLQQAVAAEQSAAGLLRNAPTFYIFMQVNYQRIYSSHNEYGPREQFNMLYKCHKNASFTCSY